MGVGQFVDFLGSAALTEVLIVFRSTGGLETSQISWWNAFSFGYGFG